MQIPLSEIKVRRSLNPRNHLDTHVIERYVEAFDQLPPIVVQQKTYVLIDGFHRYQAAKQRGETHVLCEAIAVPDNELYAEAIKRNLSHGLPLTKAERNAAIVKLYDDGWTQQAIAEWFGIQKSQVSYIVGAKIRTEKIKRKSSTVELSQELSTRQEKEIRKADKSLQDDLAEVVLTRQSVVEEKPKPDLPLLGAETVSDTNAVRVEPKQMKVSETQALVKEVDAIAKTEGLSAAKKKLESYKQTPTEIPLGKRDDGSIDTESKRDIEKSELSKPDLPTDLVKALWEVSKLSVRYSPEAVAAYLLTGKGSEYAYMRVSNAMNYLADILSKLPAPTPEAKSLKELDICDVV